MGSEPVSTPSGNRLRQLGWFVALWIAGVASLGAIAFLIRSALF